VARIGVLGCLLGATAQSEPAVTIAVGRPSSPIIVDGRLDDPAWAAAPRVILLQQSPHPGEATAYATELRTLADGNHLYIGVRCEDPQPERAEVHSLEFDGDRIDDDHITVAIDSVGNHRVGYVFEINAGGGRSDGLIGPSAPRPAYDWNGTWSAQVSRDAHGWSAEIAIDVRGLQFHRGVDTWGFNVSRYVPRDRVNLQWSGISLDASIYDLSRTGTITGVSAFVPGRGYVLTPYGLVRGDSLEHRLSTQAGFDLRFDATPSLGAILTVNPDFAETEVDADQINLTRFPLYFPEKRRFFLDGSNQFAFAAGLDQIFMPFYSRNIGLAAGLPVRLDAGLKLIGEAGGLGIGALAVHMGESAGRPSTDLAAAHFTYDIDEHLRVGTLLTRGDPLGACGCGFTGADALWHSSNFLANKNFTIAGWAARSDGYVGPGQRAGYGLYAEYPNDLWTWTLSAQNFGDALNPALGFLPRPGTHQYDVFLRYAPRPTRPALAWARQFFYEAEWTQVDGLDGRTQSRRLFTAPFNIEAPHGSHFEANWMPQFERLDLPFEIAKGVFIAPGSYDFTRFRVELESSPSDNWHYGLSTKFGEFYDGRLTELRPYMYWTGAQGHLRLELKDETDIGRVSAGRFTQRLLQLKVSYGFSPDLNLASLVQYDSDIGHVGLNTRLRWMIGAGRELFVVLNHGAVIPVSETFPSSGPISNSIVVKLRWEIRG
jgi:hypothetical protein